MANFKITPITTVSELKEQFRKEFGGVLRVYEGRSEAHDSDKLVSIGAKEGEFECRANRTVGSFEEDFKKELNLKVKVYTKDNWVAVLDGITLASVNDIPKNATKASMEEFVGYKREESKVKNNDDNPKIVKLELPNAEGLISVWDVESDRYGFKKDKESEEWIIQPIFNSGEDFSENLAVVSTQDDKYGYINALGEWVIKPIFEEARGFRDGSAPVKIDDKWGFINLLGELIFKPILDYPPFIKEGQDWIEVRVDRKKGLIDKSFNWLLKPEYEYISYSENRNLFCVQKEDKYGALDCNYKWIKEPTFEDLSFRGNKEDPMKAELDGKYGYVNDNFEWIIPPQFEEADVFEDGLASVRVNGKWGAINFKGETVINPVFDHSFSFNHGLANVVYKGVAMQVDKQGKINGKTPEQYFKENPIFIGWEKSLALANKTESVALPLHKVGDNFDSMDKIKDYADDGTFLFLVTNGDGAFKTFCGDSWDNIQEYIEENPDYDTIYYGDEPILSEEASEIYQDDYEWPTEDRTMIEAFRQPLEGPDYFEHYNYPDIDFELIYNGEVIYSGNIKD